MAELQAAVGNAIEVLTGCLNQPAERTRGQVLEAFSAWLKLTGEPKGACVCMQTHCTCSKALDAPAAACTCTPRSGCTSSGCVASTYPIPVVGVLPRPGEPCAGCTCAAFGQHDPDMPCCAAGGVGLPGSLVAHPLVAAALEGLKNEGSFSAAVDAVGDRVMAARWVWASRCGWDAHAASVSRRHSRRRSSSSSGCPWTPTPAPSSPPSATHDCRSASSSG
jgi:hypothetical protein